MKKVLFILSELSDDDIDWLIKAGNRTEVSAGTVLIEEGRSVENLYVLLDGTLSVSLAALGGQEIAQLSSGDVVGEMSFVDANPPSATVKASARSLVLSISRPLLADKLKTDVGFAARFYKALSMLLSSRLRGTVKQLSDDKEKSPTSDRQTQTAATAQAENMAIAAVRFDWLLRRLRNGDIEPGEFMTKSQQQNGNGQPSYSD